jgi:hypothetical protein
MKYGNVSPSPVRNRATNSDSGQQVRFDATVAEAKQEVEKIWVQFARAFGDADDGETDDAHVVDIQRKLLAVAYSQAPAHGSR